MNASHWSTLLIAAGTPLSAPSHPPPPPPASKRQRLSFPELLEAAESVTKHGLSLRAHNPRSWLGLAAGTWDTRRERNVAFSRDS